MCRRFACALFCASLLIVAGASAAPAAANATTAPAPAAANATAPAAGGKKVGKVGEPCAQGGACATGICLVGKCINHTAACTASAALPTSGCVGNWSESAAPAAPFNRIECNDATDKVATSLKLAEGLGSTINSTDCYSNGAASCVVLRDSAALVHYGAQCPRAGAAASGAAGRGAASAVMAAAGAVAAAALALL